MTNLPSGFSLLQAAALIGLLSLFIPILIHLFNPNRKKIIFVGNLAFIKKQPHIHMIKVRIHQWLLLVIRLFILILLTLILSQLVSNKAHELSDSTHVFISTDWLSNSSLKEKNQLINEHSNSSIFVMTKDFPKITSNDIRNYSTTQLKNSQNLSVNTLVAEIQKLGLYTKHNILYTTSKMGHYKKKQTPFLPPEYFEWRIKELTINNSSIPQINVDIYFSESRILDAQYLQLALDTLPEISNLNLNVRRYDLVETDVDLTKIPDHSSTVNWIFWLSEKSIPDVLKSPVFEGSYLFADADDNLQLEEKNKKSTAIQIGRSWVTFYSNLPSQPSNKLMAVWQNNHGNIALLSEKNKNGKIFRFNSRLNPNWTDLVTGIQFPIVISQLLTTHPKMQQRYQVSVSELEFLLSDEEYNRLANRNTLYRNYLIILLCLTWLLERFVSERSRSFYD